MSLSVVFLERREGGSPSIERVFRAVSRELETMGVTCQFLKAPFGNTFFSTLRNILLFRPSRGDVFHVTGHISYMGLVLPKESTLLTIHDLTLLAYRRGLRRWLIERLYYKWPARRVRHLTVISEATKTHLVKLAEIPAEKVKVIENPLLVPQTQAREFNAAKPTILQIGTAPNKNIDRLIEALEGIPCTLRVVGPLSNESLDLLDRLQVDYINDPSLNDDEIENAYRDADIVTLCSTNEGFGLPIIEAQASGVAVVTSDRSPMKDVSGSAAVLVAPENIGSIHAGIMSLITQPGLREELIARGRENVERFAVGRVAAEYLSVYSEIAANAK